MYFYAKLHAPHCCKFLGTSRGNSAYTWAIFKCADRYLRVKQVLGGNGYVINKKGVLAEACGGSWRDKIYWNTILDLIYESERLG